MSCILRTILENLKALIQTEFTETVDVDGTPTELPRIKDVAILPKFEVVPVYPAVQLTDGSIEDERDDARSAVYLTVFSDDPRPEEGMLDLLDLATDLKKFIQSRFNRLCVGVEDFEVWSSDPQYTEITPSEGSAAPALNLHWRTLRFIPLWLED